MYLAIDDAPVPDFFQLPRIAANRRSQGLAECNSFAVTKPGCPPCARYDARHHHCAPVMSIRTGSCTGSFDGSRSVSTSATISPTRTTTDSTLAPITIRRVRCSGCMSDARSGGMAAGGCAAPPRVLRTSATRVASSTSAKTIPHTIGETFQGFAMCALGTPAGCSAFLLRPCDGRCAMRHRPERASGETDRAFPARARSAAAGLHDRADANSNVGDHGRSASVGFFCGE